MRLLNTTSLEFSEYLGLSVPEYAILSHTWGPEEISFHEMACNNETTILKEGYRKIADFCAKARHYSFKYVWIDSCCIDKRSSAELSEAINSMYGYYSRAKVCFIYLGDVATSTDRSEELDMVQRSCWFTRGWTLQELLASSNRLFFTNDWSLIRDGEDLLHTVAVAAEIDETILKDKNLIKTVCVGQRMSWVARRETTRSEDLAYCLLGIFNISMPIIYGEGIEKAFRRLQVEIMESSFDQSLFAWRGDYAASGLLAVTPRDFVDFPQLALWGPEYLSPYSMTNIGLSIRMLKIAPKNDTRSLKRDGENSATGCFLAALQCDNIHDKKVGGVAVYLQPVLNEKEVRVRMEGERRIACRRVRCSELYMLSREELDGSPFQQMLILQDEHADLVKQSFEQDSEKWRRVILARTSLYDRATGF